ncbi:MAG: hypothetical protein HYZ27_03630 [Deltaproteobacteria bacterium]|nr:hypothetical protein [Deltaproteobacteria bacterium]
MTKERRQPRVKPRKRIYQRPTIIEEEVFDRRLLMTCEKADEECEIRGGPLTS